MAIKICFHPRTIFLSRSAEHKLYIKSPSGLRNIPLGWVTERVNMPPSLKLLGVVRFEQNSKGKIVIKTSRKAFHFEPDDLDKIVDADTGKKLWPGGNAPDGNNRGGYKWI